MTDARGAVPVESLEDLLARIQALMHEGKLQEAHALCSELMADRQGHPGLLALYGALRIKMGARDEGIECLERSLAFTDLQPFAQLQLGLAFKEAGRWPEAIGRLCRALEMEPKLFAAWAARLEIAAAQGDWVTRMRCLQAIGAIFPSHRPWARVNFVMYAAFLVVEGHVPAHELLDRLHEMPTGFEEVMRAAWPAMRQPASTERVASAIAGANASLSAQQLDCADCYVLCLVWRHLADCLGRLALRSLPTPFGFGGFMTMVADGSMPGAASIALDTMGFRVSAEVEWNTHLFRTYVLPAFDVWPDSADIGAAECLESRCAFSISQQPHTEEQARQVFAQLKPRLELVARRSWTLGNRGLSTPPPKKPPVIGFVASLAINWCSPDRVIHQILNGLRSTDPEFVPLVIAMGDVTDSARREFASLGVEILEMIEFMQARLYDQPLAVRMEGLRVELARRGVQVLVYYHCTDGFATIAGAARLAPVQIYYSMGYHYFDGPGWDDFYAVGATGQLSRTYGDKTWRTIELVHPDPYAGAEGERRRAAAADLREQLPGGLILGTIARPQKLDSDEFIDVIARILASNPRTHYLWFGTEELDSVRAKMRSHRIDERCHFCGWVDAPTYALLLDVHLDSFPFPTGITMFDSMWAGCASVFMDTAEARDTGVLLHLLPLLEGQMGDEGQRQAASRILTRERDAASLLMVAHDADEYVRHAQRLIDDAELRRAVGEANRKFMEAFKGDASIATRSFCRALEATMAGASKNQDRRSST